jgi:dolichol-phosphate mannosyltransferase
MSTAPHASDRPVPPDAYAGPGGAVRRETVALVIPLYNEEAMLPLLIPQVEAFRRDHPSVVEVVLVDDGSRDATPRLVRELTDGLPGYRVARFARNFGHQLAVTAGLSLTTTDAAVILDADLQDPLHVVARMIERWREGYDVVYGVRSEREGETAFKRGTAALFYRAFRWMTDLDIPLDTGDFRLVSRPVIDAYARLGEQQPFVRGLITWLGFNQTGVTYRRAPRAAGETKYPLRKMLRLALTSMVSFSDKPLRTAAYLGLGTSALSFAGLIYALVAWAAGATVSGWTSLIFVGFFFGGVQLFFLGVLGLYVARVHDEARRRPRYVFQSVHASDDARADSLHPTR